MPDIFFRRRRAFTLLEIILSLAILAGALAALGEVMRLADLSAVRTRDETQAQILAASVMDEIVSGARPLTTINGAALDLDTEPAWVHWIEVAPTNHVELLTVQVRVEQQLPPEQDPVQFDLVRWVANPEYLPAATPQLDTDAMGPARTSAFGDVDGLDPMGGAP